MMPQVYKSELGGWLGEGLKVMPTRGQPGNTPENSQPKLTLVLEFHMYYSLEDRCLSLATVVRNNTVSTLWERTSTEEVR